jgi:hypothetical protein
MKAVFPCIILITILILYSFNSKAQFDEQTSISLAAVEKSSIDWGDYDNDGDLDILLTGYNGVIRISKIYNNNGNNSFTEQTGILLPGVYAGDGKWGDYDNDGDLDFILVGHTGSEYLAKIFRNNGNKAFSEQTGISLPGVSGGKVSWGDYDNDGDLDFILIGYALSESAYISKIYRNNGNSTFTEQTGIGLTGVIGGSVSWSDYDNDGDLDILLTGYTGSDFIVKIYRNDENNIFTEQTGISLLNTTGNATWGDYDNDGDLDILLTGNIYFNYYSKIYMNNGNSTFIDITDVLPIGVAGGSTLWGDYDNDGDLDILLNGFNGSEFLTKIYKNDGNNSFVEQTGIVLTGVYNSSNTWCDYDNDGDLDLLLSGQTATSNTTKIYKSTIKQANTAPSSPVNLTSTINGSSATLKWDQANDTETPQDGLSYNIYLYEEGASDYIVAPHAFVQTNALNGKRLISEMGKIRWSNNGYTLRNIVENGKTYYWSVQAIDAGLSGGAFAPEMSFSAGTPPSTPVLNNVTGIGVDHFSISFNPSTNATGYRIDVAIDENFTTLLPSYTNKDIGNVTNYQVTGLTDETQYFCRVKAYNANGESNYSNVVSVKTCIFTTQITNPFDLARFFLSKWGDIDNDGDLDLLLEGFTYQDSLFEIAVYKNNGDVFDLIANKSIEYNLSVNLTWNDFDNDGYWEIACSGDYPKIFRIDGSTLNEICTGQIQGSMASNILSFDYDNDGDLDLIVSGPYSKLYNNNENGFTEVLNGSIPGFEDGSIDAGDYDNDGDLDLLLTGDDYYGSYTKIFQNTGTGFIEAFNGAITGINYGEAKWVDFDNDGELDISLIGVNDEDEKVLKIYKNSGTGFNEFFANQLEGLDISSLDWGDYDNDGDRDLIVLGLVSFDEPTMLTQIYRNDITGFTKVHIDCLTNMFLGSINWGDYNNDGKLDILTSGFVGYQNTSVKIYANSTDIANSAPIAPANLSVSANSSNVSFTWDKTTDAETPQNGLSYDIFVYKVEGSKVNSKATTQTLYCKSTNTQYSQSGYTIKNLPDGRYTWAVRAVDTGEKNGELGWGEEFVIGQGQTLAPEITVLGNANLITDGSTSTDASNFTAFSTTTINESISHDFVIQNVGTENLIINGVAIDGAGFQISQPAQLTIIPGGETHFSVTFNPVANIVYSGMVHINSNDADEGSFDFTIKGVVVPANTVTLTWNNPADIVYGTTLSGTQLNATCNITGTFAYTPSEGALLKTGQNQELKVVFTPDDLNNYSIVEKKVKINVLKAEPIITWENPSDIFYGDKLGADQLNAVSLISGTFTYIPAEGTLLNANPGQTLAVVFIPDDKINYKIVKKSVTINVLKSQAVLTWEEPSDIIFGTALSSQQLNAFTDMSGSLIYTPSVGKILNAGQNQQLKVVFSPEDTSNYAVVEKIVTIDVRKAEPYLYWENPTDITYGSILSSRQLNAISNLPGTFEYTPAEGTLLSIGARQILKVVFTPTDVVNYSTKEKAVLINVKKADPVLVWENPSNIVYGDTLNELQLDATCDIPGTFVYSPAKGTVLNAGYNQSLKVVFTPDNADNYNEIQKTVLINVQKANPVLTWENPADIVYGTLLDTNQLKASSNIEGGFIYVPDFGAKLEIGNNQLLTVFFNPLDEDNYYSVNKSVTINVLKYSDIGQNQNGNITVFPNPTDDHFTIANLNYFVGLDEVVITIISMDGKIVYSNRLTELKNEEIFDIMDLNSGFYMVRIESNGKQINKSIIKN